MNAPRMLQPYNHLRPLTEADAAEYLALLLRGVQEHPESFRISADDVRRDPLPFSSDDPDDFTLGAFSDAGRLIGIASFAREKREKMRHKGLLFRMCVASEAAGHGWGRRLIRAVVERASQQEGLEQITLTVVASNLRAKQLYESEGFERFALEKRALKIGGTYFDEEQMAVELIQG